MTTMAKGKEASVPSGETSAVNVGAPYVGTRWTRFLRAPDQFIRLEQTYRTSLVPLGEIADIVYNVKSGADAFFYVRDVTDVIGRKMDDAGLRLHFGIRGGQLGRLRIVETRDKQRFVLEDAVLRPTVFNLMGLTRIKLSAADCPRRMVVIEGTPDELKEAGFRKALQYIKWGEQRGFDRRPTCQQRVRNLPPYRQWYELRPDDEPCLLWSQAWGFRHLVPEIGMGLTANKRMFRVTPGPGTDLELLGAVLNSTWAAAWKYQFGRYTGQEGYFDTDVIAAQQLLVPDPRRFSPAIAKGVRVAYRQMVQRMIGPIHLTEKIAPNGRRTRIGDDELTQPDRRDLDELIAEAIGVEAPDREVDRLYADLRSQFDGTRAKELKALIGKAIGGGGKLTTEGMADAIVGTVPADLRKNLLDFLDPHDELRQMDLPQGYVTVGTHFPMEGEGLIPVGWVDINGQLVDCGGIEQAEWVQALEECGLYGLVPVPVDSAVTALRLQAFNAWRRTLLKAVDELIREYTDDLRRRSRIQQLVVHRVLTSTMTSDGPHNPTEPEDQSATA